MHHDDHQAIVVDPGDAAPVQAALDAQGLALIGILVTHHHPRSCGRPGRPAAAPARPRQGFVWGPARETIRGPIVPLNGGDSVTLIGPAFNVIDTMIAFESAINPFMRCAAPAVIESALLHGAADHSGAAVLGALRE